MNKIQETVLFKIRRLLSGRANTFLQSGYIDDRLSASKIIKEKLEEDEPCMIARFGNNELSTVCNYLSIQNDNHTILKYIFGRCDEWWWKSEVITHMETNAGFFPSNEENLSAYSRLVLEDIKSVDILGSWLTNENKANNLMPHCTKVRLRYLEPDFMVVNPKTEWTQALKGKRVLVIHPFVETIIKQYKKKEKLFKAPEFLPDFDLLTIKAVQSIGGSSEFKSWFDALKYMEDEMDKIDYDIAIIGCGAYGFNLAAHAKRTGHKAIHLGGATQLLFGIIGNRWADKDYYKDIINEYWCRPDSSERPKTAESVENGCYW